MTPHNSSFMPRYGHFTVFWALLALYWEGWPKRMFRSKNDPPPFFLFYACFGFPHPIPVRTNILDRGRGKTFISDLQPPEILPQRGSGRGSTERYCWDGVPATARNWRTQVLKMYRASRFCIWTCFFLTVSGFGFGFSLLCTFHTIM